MKNILIKVEDEVQLDAVKLKKSTGLQLSVIYEMALKEGLKRVKLLQQLRS